MIALLPESPYTLICTAAEAELIKYGGNCFLFTKVLFINLMYDLANRLGADFETVSLAMQADPRIGTSHIEPVFASGHVPEDQAARGAGGHCFIKDFAAFTKLYEEVLDDPKGLALLRALEAKNLELLTTTQKDIDLVEGVYGKEMS